MVWFNIGTVESVLETDVKNVPVFVTSNADMLCVYLKNNVLFVYSIYVLQNTILTFISYSGSVVTRIILGEVTDVFFMRPVET